MTDRHQWAIPVTTGQETAVCEAIDAIDGAACYAPLRAKLGRPGYARKLQVIEAILWPGYVFVSATPEAHQGVHKVKHVFPFSWWLEVRPRQWDNGEGGGIMAAIQEAERQVDRIKAEFDAGERVSEFDEDQVLRVVGGPFMDEIVRFQRAIESNRLGEVEVWHPTAGRKIRMLAVDLKAAE